MRIKTAEEEASGVKRNKLNLPRSVLTAKLNRRGPTVWVKKWVDYSTKYGLGYTLSNGSCGVYFNDNSKMIRNSDGKTITYAERKTASREEHFETFTADDAPKEI